MAADTDVQFARIEGQLNAQDAVMARQDNTLSQISQKLENIPATYVTKADHEKTQNSLVTAYRMIVGGFAVLGLALISGLFLLFGDLLPLIHAATSR